MDKNGNVGMILWFKSPMTKWPLNFFWDPSLVGSFYSGLVLMASRFLVLTSKLRKASWICHLTICRTKYGNSQMYTKSFTEGLFLLFYRNRLGSIDFDRLIGFDWLWLSWTQIYLILTDGEYRAALQNSICRDWIATINLGMASTVGQCVRTFATYDSLRNLGKSLKRCAKGLSWFMLIGLILR